MEFLPDQSKKLFPENKEYKSKRKIDEEEESYRTFINSDKIQIGRKTKIRKIIERTAIKLGHKSNNNNEENDNIKKINNIAFILLKRRGDCEKVGNNECNKLLNIIYNTNVFDNDDEYNEKNKEKDEGRKKKNICPDNIKCIIIQAENISRFAHMIYILIEYVHHVPSLFQIRENILSHVEFKDTEEAEFEFLEEKYKELAIGFIFRNPFLFKPRIVNNDKTKICDNEKTTTFAIDHSYGKKCYEKYADHLSCCRETYFKQTEAIRKINLRYMIKCINKLIQENVIVYNESSHSLRPNRNNSNIPNL